MDLNAPKNQGACCAAQAGVPVRSSQPLGLLTLAALGTASLGLIRYTDLYLYRAAIYSLPAAAWIPDARITSCLIAFALYVLVEKRWPTYREALQRKDAYWMALIGASNSNFPWTSGLDHRTDSDRVTGNPSVIR